eukprot:GHVQ01024008.1.p1 GENE.GHVQ01024008.1~~GHVQ01024008.1.p1  ORF type:complete len:300 (+),score=59.35 GHVQ01024008.1:76-975(+)
MLHVGTQAYAQRNTQTSYTRDKLTDAVSSPPLSPINLPTGTHTYTLKRHKLAPPPQTHTHRHTMKALVAVKRCIDYAVKVRVMTTTPSSSSSSSTSAVGVNILNTKMSMNPFCEIAVEESIRLKEKGCFSEVVAVCIGNDKCQDTLRQAMAMGVDRAVLMRTDMRTDQELQPLAVAKLLHYIVMKEHPLLVLTGKQAIDDDSSQCGQMLAALLGWPQATCASQVELSKQLTDVIVAREVDAGLQHLRLTLPAVVTCDLRLNEPRYATLPNLMKAKKKRLQIVEAESLGIDIQPRLEVKR